MNNQYSVDRFIRPSLESHYLIMLFFFVSTRRLNVSGEWYRMISACTAAGDIDKSLKNLKQSLIGKEKSRVKDGRVLAHLESVIVIQVQFHIIGRWPFQFSAASRNWFVLILVGGWNIDEGTSQPFFPGDHRRSTKKIYHTENESEY